MRTTALILLAALAAAPAQARTPDPGRADDVNVDADACEVVRIAPNGARTVTPPKRSGAGGTASVSSRGAGSSVSVSSRGGGSSAASSSVSSGGRSHSITTTQDDKGCRIVIDERSARGESR